MLSQFRSTALARFLLTLSDIFERLPLLQEYIHAWELEHKK